MAAHCECTDPGCPVHKGTSSCARESLTTLYRVDTADETGTAMCEACADDAMASGLFSTVEGDDEDDDSEDDE